MAGRGAQAGAAGRVLEGLPAVAAASAAGNVPADPVGLLTPMADEQNRTAAAAQGVQPAGVDRLMADTAAPLPCADSGRGLTRTGRTEVGRPDGLRVWFSPQRVGSALGSGR